MKEELMVMRHYCRKYGINQWSINRNLQRYQTAYVDGAVKPRIIDNEHNRLITEELRKRPANRPQNPALLPDEFIKRFGIDPDLFRRRYRSLEKRIVGDAVLIQVSANNKRHCKLIS